MDKTTLLIQVAAGIAVGAMVANLQGYGNAIGMAEGGVLNARTVVYAGEAGPEIYMPLSKYEAQRARDLNIGASQVGDSPTNVTTIQLTQNFYGDINSPADEDRIAQKTVDKLDEDLYRRRGS